MTGDSEDDTSSINSVAAIVSGQIWTGLDLTDLAAAFGQGGMTAHLRQSSLYTNGHYLLVSQDEAALSFERIAESEILVDGTAPSSDAMNHLVAKASQVLTLWALRHRFEVYGQQPSQLLGYFHHHWPLTWSET